MNGEKVFLILAFVALAVVVLWNVGPIKHSGSPQPVLPPPDPNPDMGGLEISQTPADMGQGPAYLIYNTKWAFAPPIGNFLPRTARQAAVTIDAPMSAASGASLCA